MSNKEFPTQEEWAEAVARLEKSVAETRAKTVTVGEVRDCYEGIGNLFLVVNCSLSNIRHHLSTSHPEALGTLVTPGISDPELRKWTLQDVISDAQMAMRKLADAVDNLNALGHNTPDK